MADKRKTKKRKEEFGEPAESEKPSSEEYAVAKWLKANVPTKKTKFLNHHVEYFTGAKAIDALLTSKWATGKSPTFTTRLEVSDFLHTMLLHKLFHRAKKVPVTEQELKGKKKKLEKNSKSGDEKDEASACEGKDAKDKDKDKEKEKKKRKIRLEMHMEQVFLDTPDAYVWIYDPMPWYYWVCGALVVFGTIGVCMFPLWPATVRKGVYYLSVAAAAFLVLIIALTVLRVVIFCLVWMVTLSRHHLWLLPNLTEDVGFLASFWPLYKLLRVVMFCLVWMMTLSRHHLWLLPNLTDEDVGLSLFWPLYKYEYRGPSADSDKSSKNKKKRKKDKLSDDEAEKPLIETTTTTTQDDVTDTTDAVIEETSGDTKSGTDTPLEKPTASESDSENSQRSSTDRDFEMVDPGDLEPDKET